MPIWMPSGDDADYQWSFSSTSATRIAAAWGTSVTPAQNAYGTAVQICSSANVARDVFAIEVNFNSGGTSTAARDMLAKIQVDPAGGTTWADLVTGLLCSACSPALGAFGSGISYVFPIWIKAGSAIAVAASVNNATVGTVRARMKLWGSPRRRDFVKVGNRIVSLGVTAGTSTGTAVTPGTTADGAWTALGTVASTDDPWWWQFGCGTNQGTELAVAYTADLAIGDASNKFIVSEDRRIYQGTTAEIWYDNGPEYQGAHQAKGGDIVYGRMQCSGTAAAAKSMAAYGVI
jgi:hypothetical protein